ncbi:MAG: hypothetical protein KM310_01200 [Clostridiales bacterium]|nr:hypothetical protein [Clostridiales bacterium]
MDFRRRTWPWELWGREPLPLWAQGTVLVSLLLGAVLGAVAAGSLPPAVRQELVEALREFFASPSWPSAGAIFWRAFSIHGLTWFFLWMGSYSTFGFLLIPSLLLFRGFLWGFASSFLLLEGGFIGLVVAALSLWPSQFLLLFLWWVWGARALYGAAQRRPLSGKDWGPALLWLTAASLLDAYGSPAALHWILGMVNR